MMKMRHPPRLKKKNVPSKMSGKKKSILKRDTTKEHRNQRERQTAHTDQIDYSIFNHGRNWKTMKQSSERLEKINYSPGEI